MSVVAVFPGRVYVIVLSPGSMTLPPGALPLGRYVSGDPGSSYVYVLIVVVTFVFGPGAKLIGIAGLGEGTYSMDLYSCGVLVRTVVDVLWVDRGSV